VLVKHSFCLLLEELRYRSFTELLDEYLDNPKFAMSFLNQALADEDIEAFTLSLKDIMRVYGRISNLAKKAALSRGTLYKIMQGTGQTEMGTLLKVLHALGYDLTITKRKSSRQAARA
jgi:probable addiction module antidote protein